MWQKQGAVTLRSRNRFATLVCWLSLGLGFLPAPPNHLAANPLLKRHEYALPRMGTMFRIEMYSADDAEASKAAEAAFARAEELEQIMSDYRPDSELMHLSHEGAKAPFPVSSDLYDVLAKSLGSTNHANVVKATVVALKSLRRRDEIFKLRGIRGHDGVSGQAPNDAPVS